MLCSHAIATVFHLAMHRIVGREGGYQFDEIYKHLVDAHGTADTESVLTKFCPDYHLHFNKLMKQMRGRPSTKGGLWLQHLTYMMNSGPIIGNFIRRYQKESSEIVVGEF